MSSHLNSRYWARLSVTLDFSDTLAGLCYKLIRWGIIFAEYASACLFTLILINTNNVLLREDLRPEDSTSQKIIINISVVVVVNKYEMHFFFGFSNRVFICGLLVASIMLTGLIVCYSPS